MVQQSLWITHYIHENFLLCILDKGFAGGHINIDRLVHSSSSNFDSRKLKPKLTSSCPLQQIIFHFWAQKFWGCLEHHASLEFFRQLSQGGCHLKFIHFSKSKGEKQWAIQRFPKSPLVQVDLKWSGNWCANFVSLAHLSTSRSSKVNREFYSVSSKIHCMVNFQLDQ